jgi:hypothetical protein
MAVRYSTAAVAMGHNALTRAIRHAEARDLVRRNVAMLVGTPKGQAGRPSNHWTGDTFLNSGLDNARQPIPSSPGLHTTST